VKQDKTTQYQDFLRESLLAQTAHIMETALKAEVDEFLGGRDQKPPDSSHSRIVYNGYLPERRVKTPLGQLSLNVPRLRDRAKGEKIRFVSRIVPPYGRSLPVLGPSLAWSYLSGLMSGEFKLALSIFLGSFSPRLGPGIRKRLRNFWQEDYEDFRDLAIDPAAYRFFWAKAHGPVRGAPKGQAYLALAGITDEGRKDFLGLVEGDPLDGEAWAGLFRLLRKKGLLAAPRPTLGAPDLGVWSGLSLCYGGRWDDGFWDDGLAFGPKDRLAEFLERLPPESKAAAGPILDDIGRARDFSAAMAGLLRLAGGLGDLFPGLIKGLMA
jgi:hypothetical protein